MMNHHPKKNQVLIYNYICMMSIISIKYVKQSLVCSFKKKLIYSYKLC